MALIAGGLLGANPLAAQIGVGTWVRKPTASTPGTMTMKVEACCGQGRRLTYQFDVGNSQFKMVVESKFDGSEAPVMINGKPSGETMAIKRVDDRHTATILKMNGKPFGTSKATLSADGKTITVDNDVSAATGGLQVGKSTEVWVKK
jgi:hypothetical protein